MPEHPPAQGDRHRGCQRQRKDHADQADAGILHARQGEHQAGRDAAGNDKPAPVEGKERGGDAGRIHILRYHREQHCRRHRTAGHRTAEACRERGEHKGIHRLAPAGLQHQNRHGGERTQPGAETEAADSKGRVQESRIPLL